MDKNIYEGMLLSFEELQENGLKVISKEEYDKKLESSNNQYNKFISREEWMKYIEWKPVNKQYYCINVEENKYKVISINKYAGGLENILHIQKNLDNLFKYHPLLNSFRYNEFTQKDEFNGKRFDWDKQPAEIHNFFKRNFNEWCPRKDIEESIQETLNRNSYHPIKEWLNGLIWDGEERLETFLIDWYGAEDSPLNRVYFKRWMIALIKRIMVPGSKFDSMLILAGLQGKKKTTLFTWLGTINDETYYAEAPDNLKNLNDVIYSSLGKYILTFDDFDDICNKGDLGKIKSFITTQERTAALKWKHDNQYKITYVLGASTNMFDILVDDSSFDERRFWIVMVDPKSDEFNIPDEIKEQLFAEAYYLYNEDPDQKLWIWEKELKEEEKKLQKQFKKAGSDPTVETIVNIFNRKYPIVNGMFDSEEHFKKCVKSNTFNDKCDELSSEMIGSQWEYIKVIPAAWIINYLNDKDYNRGTDRIIQILYNQGFNVEKKTRYWIYQKLLTVIKIDR